MPVRLTGASRARFARLFEEVASDSKNLRPDLPDPQQIQAGVQVFTKTCASGRQVWVHVRAGQIVNAGLNAEGFAR